MTQLLLKYNIMIDGKSNKSMDGKESASVKRRVKSMNEDKAPLKSFMIPGKKKVVKAKSLQEAIKKT